MLFLPLILGACAQAPQNPLALASFSENSVSVTISLQHDDFGQDFLSATFTPPQGYHLYSKDIPARGINGQGRPTRLELSLDSQAEVLGDLMESAGPQALGYGGAGLLVYPAGPVTLSLPIQLPDGRGWFKDEVKVSFMACTNNQCTPPVEKLLGIRLPGAELFNKP
jgi:hypothetical protein